MQQTDVTDAIEQNEADAYRAAAMAAGGTFAEEGAFAYVNNRPHWPSYLLLPRFDSPDDPALQALGARIEARELPPFFKVGPKCRSDKTQAVLEAAGFVQIDRPDAGMALELGRLGLPTLPTTPVEIVEASAAQIRAYGPTLRLAPETFVPLSATRGAAVFFAIVGGEAVATATLYRARGVGGIYMVFVKEAFRRRGIGLAVTRAALERAREGGDRLAVLSASAMGEPVYLGLGFEVVFRYEFYRWGAMSYERWAFAGEG